MRLPAVTLPPAQPTSRQHNPSPVKSYELHKPCLQWDFGFTCAFCLLHESDYNNTKSTFSVEHIFPQSTHPQVSDQYKNCVYACKECNEARKVKPNINASGARLLDPTQNAWGAHFKIEADRLESKINDLDATYTSDAYQINAPEKVVRRKKRRETIQSCQRRRTEKEQFIEPLLDLASRQSNKDNKKLLLDSIRILCNDLEEIQKTLEGYRAIPLSAPTKCRCTSRHIIPVWISKQCTH